MNKEKVLSFIYDLLGLVLFMSICVEWKMNYVVAFIVSFVFVVIFTFLPIPLIKEGTLLLFFLITFIVRGRIHYFTLLCLGIWIIWFVVIIIVAKISERNAKDPVKQVIKHAKRNKRIIKRVTNSLKKEVFNYTYSHALEYRRELGITDSCIPKDEAKEYIDKVIDLITNEENIEKLYNYERKGSLNPYEGLELNAQNGIFMDVMEYFIFGNYSEENRCNQMDEELRKRLIFDLWSIAKIILPDDVFDKELELSVESAKKRDGLSDR